MEAQLTFFEARSAEEYCRRLFLHVLNLQHFAAGGALLTDFPTQVVVPSWKLAVSRFRVLWEGEEFKLYDPKGTEVEVTWSVSRCVAGAEELIEWLEKKKRERRATRRGWKLLGAGEPGRVKKFQESRWIAARLRFMSWACEGHGLRQVLSWSEVVEVSDARRRNGPLYDLFQRKTCFRLVCFVADICMSGR